MGFSYFRWRFCCCRCRRGHIDLEEGQSYGALSGAGSFCSVHNCAWFPSVRNTEFLVNIHANFIRKRCTKCGGNPAALRFSGCEIFVAVVAAALMPAAFPATNFERKGGARHRKGPCARPRRSTCSAYLRAKTTVAKIQKNASQYPNQHVDQNEGEGRSTSKVYTCLLVLICILPEKVP